MIDILTFEFNRFKTDFFNMMVKTSEIILDEYYNEIKFNMNTDAASNDLKKSSKYERDKYYITITVIGYANAIMDSYGTGTKMDLNNPFLRDYKNNGNWNPIRYDNAIRKRPKGTYTNIYGEIIESNGNGAGFNLERVPGYEPIAPSKAFQDAEIWFIKGNRAKQILDSEIKKFFKSSSKYFIYRK